MGGEMLVGSFCGLIDDQHGNVIANRVDAPANLALQAVGGIGERVERSLALRANENVEKVFRNRHDGSAVEA